jgi:hypothetical protein
MATHDDPIAYERQVAGHRPVDDETYRDMQEAWAAEDHFSKVSPSDLITMWETGQNLGALDLLHLNGVDFRPQPLVARARPPAALGDTKPDPYLALLSDVRRPCEAASSC